MKNTLISSLLSAFIIEAIGAMTNLISYFIFGKFLFAQVLYGGECQVWRGFGIALTKIYPMKSVIEPYEIYTRISFDYASLHVTLFVGFMLSFVVFNIIKLIKKKDVKITIDGDHT